MHGRPSALKLILQSSVCFARNSSERRSSDLLDARKPRRGEDVVEKGSLRSTHRPGHFGVLTCEVSKIGRVSAVPRKRAARRSKLRHMSRPIRQGSPERWRHGEHQVAIQIRRDNL